MDEAFVHADQGGSFAFEDGAIRVNIPPRASSQDARLKFSGLTPNLALSYSSTAMDMLNSNAQVSYLGAGWGFDTGYVARDTRNTFSTSDDVYSIVLNGASYDLILGADGFYHTGKEQYWKISFQNNKWTVITNDGTTYVFGDSTATRALEWRRDQW